MIGVEYVNMPVATFVRFQPESSDFFEIYDHKAVLENALRNFACLTQGDQISIKYNDREYQLNILVTEPNIAVSIFECDMRVDFAEPVNGSTKDNSIHDDHDHKKEQSLASKAVKQSHNFPGSGRRLDGKSTPAACASAISQVRGIPDYDYLPNKLTFFRNHNSHIKAEEKFEAKLAGDPFTPFTGKGRTLHG
ncbi:hypothetical protein GJ496_003921 [Pomphorhynchus laevis]|nr:hypothetical protein GJ496_003921 [Pomphorhynchus laevis]